MWSRLALASALLIAGCAAREPALRLPESPVPRKARPARWEDLPQDAVPYAVESRAVALHVRSGESTIDLEAHCRVGVWTTLQRIRALPFIVRESWGRLGERPPRRLSQSVDDILTGVIARVRPLSDGTLEFRIEVAQGYLAETRDLGEFEGSRILLPRPRRYGYRFAGRVPRGHAQGPIAAWLPGVVIHLGSPGAGTRPPGHLTFKTAGIHGFVAGTPGLAESFAEDWNPAPARRFDGDGVLRADFFFARPSHSAGGLEWQRGNVQWYGTRFSHAWVDGR